MPNYLFLEYLFFGLLYGFIKYGGPFVAIALIFYAYKFYGKQRVVFSAVAIVVACCLLAASAFLNLDDYRTTQENKHYTVDKLQTYVNALPEIYLPDGISPARSNLQFRADTTNESPVDVNLDGLTVMLKKYNAATQQLLLPNSGTESNCDIVAAVSNGQRQMPATCKQEVMGQGRVMYSSTTSVTDVPKPYSLTRIAIVIDSTIAFATAEDEASLSRLKNYASQSKHIDKKTVFEMLKSDKQTLQTLRLGVY